MNIGNLTWFAAALLTVAPAPGQTQAPRETEPGKDAPPPRSMSKLLDSPVKEVLFEEVPFEQVASWLADYTGVNIWVRWQVLAEAGIARDKPITIRVRNLRLSQVLWMILTEAGGPDVKLGYGSSENLLIISTRADLGDELVVRVYDVRDLLTRAPRFRNRVSLDAAQVLRQAGQSGGTGVALAERSGGDESGDELEADADELVALITAAIEPETWVTNGGLGTITAWRGKLVVRNSLYVHQQLGGALEEIKTR